MTKQKSKPLVKVTGIEENSSKFVSTPFTEKEILARKEQAKNMVRLAGGFPSIRTASFGMGADVSMASAGNFYSPQLSTDFLEKPQNLRERRAWYRHFYNSSEIVGAAIDLHSTLPLSKIRLRKPKANNPHTAEYSYRFFTRMADRLNLLQSLSEISHEFWLFGNCILYTEDFDPYAGYTTEVKESLKAKGKSQSDMLLSKYQVPDKDPNDIGWRKLTVLPPDQVRITKKPFADNPIIEYLPDSETRSLLNAENSTMGQINFDDLNDEYTKTRIPTEMASSLSTGGTVVLQQDPSQGSFAHHFARKKSQYETMGVSILERCINTLLVKDKLRQAQTSIASRHMTPTRVVWGDQLNAEQVEDLRMQIDMALMDPDYSIIANYEVHWDEYGSNQRLLELSTEFDRYDSDLCAGLGVTKEILTGESTYTGSKISLEILNIQYLQYRDMLQEFVEKMLFEPVAIRKGFVETDEYGLQVAVYPKLSFTRMSLKDNDSLFEQVMQLYNKGSIPIDDVYDIIGFDGDASSAKLKDDLFTVRDSSFNDLLRGAYQSVAQDLVTKTNLTQKAASSLGLAIEEPPTEGDAGAGGGMGGLRFASDEGKSVAAAINMIMKNPELAKLFVKFAGGKNAAK